MWCFQRLKWAIMQHFPHPGVYSVLKPHFSHEWWESLSTPAWLFLLYQDVGLSLSFSHICGYRQRLRGAVWMWDRAALFSTGYGWGSGSSSSSLNYIMYSQQAARCLAASLLISVPILRYCGCWGIYPGSIYNNNNFNYNTKNISPMVVIPPVPVCSKRDFVKYNSSMNPVSTHSLCHPSLILINN